MNGYLARAFVSVMQQKYLKFLIVELSLTVLANIVVAEDKFFTVERSPVGVWWFVDPRGEPMVSLGVSDIPSGPNREQYDPANPGYAAFRYYSSTDEWIKSVRRNLKEWGFNTVGAWGDPGLAVDDLPETRVLHWGSGLHVPWCDLFADDFQKQIEVFAERDVAPQRNNTKLIGWFTDNELQWYADTIFHFHLHNKQQTHTREKLIDLLREHYRNDFDALRKDFVVGQATSFAELGREGTVQLVPDGHGIQLINRFTFLVAEHYYRVVHDAIRKHDQNHLILGDRYMSYCPPEVARAAGPYLDVISTNFDWPDWVTGELPTHYLKMLHDESGKPVLITEWYVAARENRSGNRNRGVSFTIVQTQDQRAATAERRLGELLNEPYVVGAHWFRYADEPTNGRPSDGEDFNFGLVDIHDQPYDKLVEAMKRANRQAIATHTGSSGTDDTGVSFVVRHAGFVGFPGCVEQFSPVTHEGLSPLADLRVAWDDNQLYLGLVGFRFVDPQLFAGGKISASHHQRLSLKLGDDAFELIFNPDAKSGVQQAQLSMIETQHRHLGVRFTYLIKVPVKHLPSVTSLRGGNAVPLDMTLRDLGGRATRWRTSLKLVDEAERLAEQAAIDAIPR